MNDRNEEICIAAVPQEMRLLAEGALALYEEDGPAMRHLLGEKEARLTGAGKEEAGFAGRRILCYTGKTKRKGRRP